jgi:Putative adhesin
MNRPNRNLYLLAAATLVVAGCHGGERRASSNSARATITRNWPAAGISTVKVVEVDGNISVEAAPGNEISLLATAKGDLEIKKGEENEGLFETVIVGDTLRIGRREKEREDGFRFFWDMDDVQIDYVLRVPATVSMAVTTVNGKIVTKGVDGDMKAATINGPIDIETAGTGALQATTVNGRVRAKFTREFHGARFKTVNGGVMATLPASASFAVNLSQVNGDFEASFPLSIHSNPGSRRVSGDVNGGAHELRIVTVNGDVELARLNGNGTL